MSVLFDGATRNVDGSDNDGNNLNNDHFNDLNNQFPLAQHEDQDISNQGNHSSSSGNTTSRSFASASANATEEFQLRLDLSPSLQDVISKKRELHNIFENFSTPILSEIQKLDIRIEKRLKKLESYHNPTTDLPTALRQFFHAEFNPTTISSTEFPQTEEFTTRGLDMLNTFKGEMTGFILFWMEQEKGFLVAKREETISKFVSEAQELLKLELAKCRPEDRTELGKSIQSLLQTKLNTRASTLTKVKSDPLSFSTQVEQVDERTSSTSSILKRPLGTNGNNGNSKSDGDKNHVKEKQQRGKSHESKNSNNQRTFFGQKQNQGRGKGNSSGRQTTSGRGRGRGDGRQHTDGRENRSGRS
jgi:hypothetical protein